MFRSFTLSFSISLALGIICFSAHGQTALVQPYLQLATPTDIVIMWETNTNTESIVEYGLDANLGSTTTGSTITTLNNTILHTVRVKGLTANTRYYYKAVTGSWSSAIFDFVTQPTRDSEANFNIVLMSDMQKDGSNPTIFNDLINTSLLPYVAAEYGSPLNDFVQMAVLPGDVVDNGNTYAQWKNDFFDPGQALWRAVPSYPAIGNHEVNSANYFNYFTLPENGTPGYLEHWYYHDYSNVRVLSLNSNSPYRIQAQLDWVDSILTLSCADPLIDFVFAELHHPFKSELWTPGNTNYTGDVIELLEDFSTSCGKPSIHFFGHTHAYSRGQSRDHDHLWVNVATSGGRIDSWGEYPNADYEEFIVSEDDYGFVMVEITAGDDPQVVVKRLSFGDASNPGGSAETDYVVIRKNNTAPNTPYPLFPTAADTVSAFCFTLKADAFYDSDGDEQGGAQWQISADSSDFTHPVFDSWKQYANWYYEVDLQASDDLTDEEVTALEGNETYYWRTRYRDKSLEWSEWSLPQKFFTHSFDTLSDNLVLNPGAENGITSWIATIGVIESLTAGECNGISPYQGSKYFAVGALCVEHPYASAYQDLNVNGYAATIDSGTVQAQYGAYMANWANTDEPAIALQFLNEANVVIGSTDTMRHNLAPWTLKLNIALVPAGTRTIRTNLMGTRTAGADNDSYVDSVFCSLLSGDIVCGVYTAPGPLHHRIYVDKDAVATPDGKSWTTAYRTPGAALLQSNTDTSIQEIWIAEGIYPVTSTTVRDTSFAINRAVSIYGGFDGSETFLAQRDLNSHTTILSGEIGDTSLITDNVYHVLSIQNGTDTLLLDGLNICCGYADGDQESVGGGIHIASSNTGPVYLHQCTVTGNYALEGSSLYNAATTWIDASTLTSEVIEGTTGSAILNTGETANLSLSNTSVIQLCATCSEVIRNLDGATLTVEESVLLEKE